MSQKLDSFSKILMATGAINYMASSIEGVNQQMKMMKSIPIANEDWDKIHGEGVKERDQILSETVTKLAAIMEDLGNIINGHSCICAVDIFATKAAFEVVVHGNDDTEGDFDNL